MAQQQIPLQYARGQVCHTTLLVEDLNKAKTFFNKLFGWKTEDVSGDAPYLMVYDSQGLPIIGLGGREPNLPEFTTYVDVANLQDATEKVLANGGQVTGEPVHVPGRGTWCLFRAPETNASFALWQDANPAGAGARTWQHERMVGTIVGRPVGCNDAQKVAEFFNNVFGWDIQTENDPNTDATIYVYDDKGGAGGVFYPQNAGIRLNPQEIHILVKDINMAVETATANGGTALGAPVDFPGWGTKQDIRIPGGPVMQIWSDMTRDR